MYDDRTGKVRQFEEELNIQTKMIVVNNEIFAFDADHPLLVYKYSTLIDNEQLTKTNLASLDLNDTIYDFSIVNLANQSIVLTGGYEYRSYIVSAKTFMMDV